MDARGNALVFLWQAGRKRRKARGKSGGQIRTKSRPYPSFLGIAATWRPSISDNSESARARSSRTRRACRAASRISGNPFRFDARLSALPVTGNPELHELDTLSAISATRRSMGQDLDSLDDAPNRHL